MRYLSLLDRYIGRTILASVFLVLLVLLGLFTLFELIGEFESLGPGDYGATDAVYYVAMRMPRLCYELFPSAAMIGSLLGLSTLARNGELAVMRFAGMSRSAVVGSVMKCALVLVICVVALGEFVSPVTEQHAHNYRSTKRVGQISLGTLTGAWVRDGNTYINIRQVLPGDEIRDVYIYEFDDANRLRTSTHAQSARFADGKWLLENIVQTRLDDGRVTASQSARADWESLLNPDLIAVVTLDSDRLSVLTLARFIRYLEANGQGTATYRYALWVKIVYPLATVAMILLAIPMVLGRLARTAAAGQGVLVGTVIGLGFHIVNRTVGHLAVVFGISPALSAVGPTLAVLVVAVLLMRRLR